MNMRTPLLAVAALAAAAISTGVGVSPAFAEGPASVTISYADLNLASAAGRTTFNRRVAGAADRLCGTASPLNLKFVMIGRACRADIAASAVASRRGTVQVSSAAY